VHNEKKSARVLLVVYISTPFASIFSWSPQPVRFIFCRWQTGGGGGGVDSNNSRDVQEIPNRVVGTK